MPMYGSSLARSTSYPGRPVRQRSPKIDPEKRRKLAKIDLHWGQWQVWQAYHRDHKRILSMFAGSGGGKTWFGPRFFYPIIREKPGATYLFIEPTWRMVKRVMVPVVEEFYGAFNMGRLHKGDMVYELNGGGRILFASVDNPNSLQGVHIDGGAWPDEIGLYTEEAWDVILQRCALHRAPILPTSTPYTLPWVERRLAKPARDPREMDEYFCIQFPSHYNPAYPRDQYFALKRKWPQDKFDRLMRGQFTRVGGLMFEEFDEGRNLAQMWYLEPVGGQPRIWFQHPIDCPQGEERILTRTWLSQDWGWSPDPGVQLLFGQDAYGRRYVIEEDSDTFIPVDSSVATVHDTWVRRAQERQARWLIDSIYCDPSRPDDIAAMRANGLPAVKANNKIDQGTDRVNEALRQLGGGLGAGLYINHSCVELVRTVPAYVRARAAGTEDVYLATPAPYQDDHAPDGLRYGIIGDQMSDRDGGVYDLEPTILAARRGGQRKG